MIFRSDSTNLAAYRRRQRMQALIMITAGLSAVAALLVLAFLALTK